MIWGSSQSQTVRIRREHASGKAIKEIARDLRLSRKVVRKAIRAPEGAFDYHRSVQPLPRIGPFQERLDTLLTENEARHRRDRLRMTRIHDLLRRDGFEGSYDAVRRYTRRWTDARRKDPGGNLPAFIPLLFKPGEAYHFDWSHEDVEIAGKPMRVKVAHMRLCASRAVYVRAYPRETQEMVFDAHARAFAFFGGVPLRGIYDSAAAVDDPGDHCTGKQDGGDGGVRRQGARLQPPVPGHGRSLHGRADRLLAGRRLGEGSGREPGPDDPWPLFPAPAAVRQPGRVERLAGR